MKKEQKGREEVVNEIRENKPALSGPWLEIKVWMS